MAGYGFVHLPMTAGSYRLDISLWRPTGSSEQELSAFLLGNNPALITQDPIYESAWKERCRLITVAAGKVAVDVFVATRYLKKHGVDERS
jgi:hypothetical protein